MSTMSGLRRKLSDYSTIKAIIIQSKQIKIIRVEKKSIQLQAIRRIIFAIKRDGLKAAGLPESEASTNRIFIGDPRIHEHFRDSIKFLDTFIAPFVK